MGLTGGYRFRKGLRGKTVLQVEEEFTPFWSAPGVVKRRWRDATMIDLADPTLRSLIDIPSSTSRGAALRIVWAPASCGFHRAAMR